MSWSVAWPEYDFAELGLTSKVQAASISRNPSSV
jgi:hypothetical protein